MVPDIVMPYFGRLAQAISSLAFTQGLELLVATTDWDLAKEQANLRALVERRVEGIIVVSVDRHQDFGPYTAMGTPIVVVDRPEFAVRGSALVTQHLISHGHKKIALLGGPEGIVSTQRRYEGWRDVMAENHLHSGDDYVVAAPLTEPGGYDAVEQLLAMDPAPTAALVATDVQAFGVLRRLYERGVAVPAIWHSPSPTRQNLPSSQCPR
ncbi:substrate-binding domain-containing protein [Ruania alba]|uniref:substrate-binding domain-containing protein n=1 Tax=Ruania alba TaxID=648782 RepID=UPI003CCBD536